MIQFKFITLLFPTWNGQRCSRNGEKEQGLRVPLFFQVGFCLTYSWIQRSCLKISPFAPTQSIQQDNSPSLAKRLKKTDAREIESFYQEYYENYVRTLDKGEQADR